MSFLLKETTDVELCISLRNLFHILGASKAKVWPKCLIDLRFDE